MSQPKSTPLYQEHVDLKARIVDFAGFLMPVQYTSIMAEAKAVREDAGMFDVSHMARLKFTGSRTLEYLEWVTSNDVASLSDGVGQYSLLPNAKGGTVDDIIVTRLGQDVFRMVVNAGCHAKDVAHLIEQNTFGVSMEDQTDDTVMIAVQGPKAVEKLLPISEGTSLSDRPLFGFWEGKVAGIDCFATRGGYTGEDGYEFVCAKEKGSELWKAFLAAGVTPCGLGSRDTLRVEAGLPLYGHELTEDMSPLCAGLGWVISKTKTHLGSNHMARVRAEGVPLKLQGLKFSGKRLATPESSVWQHESLAGHVSSGVVSPMLECGIAFAFLKPEIKLGQAVEVAMRSGSKEPVTVVSKRFLKKA